MLIYRTSQVCNRAKCNVLVTPQIWLDLRVFDISKADISKKLKNIDIDEISYL